MAHTRLHTHSNYYVSRNLYMHSQCQYCGNNVLCAQQLRQNITTNIVA